MSEAMDYSRDPVAFFDDFILKNELGRPFQLLPHQREILPLMFDFDEEGRLPWDTILYSCTKKSGKTTVNAGITTWWGYTQEPPNECLILANDGEQAASRVFRTVTGLIRHNAELSGSAKLEMAKITLSNGTHIPWLSCDYAGSAGSNHGLTSWDELWGYHLRRQPPPVGRTDIGTDAPQLNPHDHNIRRALKTNRNSCANCISLVSVLMNTRMAKVNASIRHCRSTAIGRRASVATGIMSRGCRGKVTVAIEAQRRNLRPNAYLRLHENRWIVSESRFISSEMWDSCVNPELRPLLPDARDLPHARRGWLINILCGGGRRGAYRQSGAAGSCTASGNPRRRSR